MTSPVLALRAAIRAVCAADTVLAGLMDATIHDEAPRNAARVYATFGEVGWRDASTSTEGGDEQEPSIAVWAKPGSAATALEAAERLAKLLHDASLTLDGHHLVSLAVTGLAAERDEKAASASVTLRLRAVTEPLP